MKSLPILLFMAAAYACAPKQASTTKNMMAEQEEDLEAVTSTVVEDTLILYNSAANGDTELKLAILSNHRFDLYVQTVPPPKSPQKSITTTLAGIWDDVDEKKRLTFQSNKKMVKTLFDSSSINKKHFKMINDSVVDINDKLEGIFIGGVLCEKKNRP